jgi:hypothetical protein
MRVGLFSLIVAAGCAATAWAFRQDMRQAALPSHPGIIGALLAHGVLDALRAGGVAALPLATRGTAAPDAG